MKKTFPLLLIILILAIFTACEQDIQIISTARPSPTLKPTIKPTIEATEPIEETPVITTPAPTPIPDGAEMFHALFLYDQSIYQFKNLTISKFLDDNCISLELSPDKSKFATVDKETVYSKGYLNVYDLEGNNLIHTEISEHHNFSKWVDNETILIEAHYNPNSSSYIFHNISNNSFHEVVGKGLSFIPDSNHYVYYDNAPMAYNYCLNINDKVVYRTNSNDTVITDYAFNSKGNEVAITEVILNTSKMLFRVFTYDKNNIELIQTHMCEIDFKNYSQSNVFYSNNDEIYLDFGKDVFSFDIENNMVVKVGEYIKTPHEDSPDIKVRNNVLQDIVIKKFGHEFNKVYDINWLS